MRIKKVEAMGSGLKRVNSYYKKIGLNFKLNVLPSAFIITLPKISLINDKSININADTDIIVEYIEKNGSITRKKAEALIKKEKTTASIILNKLVKDNILVKVSKGPSTRYEKLK